MKIQYIFYVLIILIALVTSSCTSEISYAVNFDSNGGTLVAPVYVMAGRTIEIPTTSREGYSLDGWYTSINNGQTLDEKWSFTYNTVNSNIILYAKWSINQYTLTFDSNGGSSISSITQDYNTNISVPTPYMEGYTFKGWLPELPSMMPSDNLSFTAQWQINQYTITFESNGGTQVNSITESFKETITAPNNPSKEGYDFNGWYTDITMEIEYVFSNVSAENITLYAKWNSVLYDIFYETYGGVIESNPSTYTIETEDLTLNEPTKEGHTFLGWYSSGDYVGQEITVITKGTTGIINLYAKWQKNQYIITFDANGGTPVDKITSDFDSEIPIPEDPTRTGYTFVGWDPELPIRIPSENLRLIAKWQINQYTINFDANGGTPVDKITADFDSVVLIPADPTRTGYTFVGWDPELPIRIPSENSTLVAQWDTNIYTITHYAVKYDNTVDLPLYPGERVKYVAAYNNNSAVLTTSNRVFVWGSLSDNSLKPVEKYFNLQNNEVISEIHLGGSHAAVLTSIGRLLMWGSNIYGQSSNELNLYLGETIVEVSLGDSHSAALTSSGRLLMWGMNEYGQLGDSTTTNRFSAVDITAGLNLNPNETIKQISLGYYHSAILTSSGRIFTWGDNSYGIIGNGNNIDQKAPYDITNKFTLTDEETISFISMGYEASTAISNLGNIYMWGYLGPYSIKSLPYNVKSQFSLNNYEHIIEVSSGGSGWNALSSNNSFFSWTTTSAPTNITPKFNLDENESIIQVESGGAHSIALSSYGKLYLWGTNDSGQLGNGTSIQTKYPYQMELYGCEVLRTIDINYLYAFPNYTHVIGDLIFMGWYKDYYSIEPIYYENVPAYDVDLYGYWIPKD